MQLWDLFGEQGHPIRTTVTEMGPLLLARLMNLNEVQEGVLTIAFHVADKEGLLLLDLDDLQAMLVNVGERADELTLEYGNVSKQSVGAIQRSLLQLRSQGGDHFFGEPALDLDDFLQRRRQRPRSRQHPRRRQADAEPAALFDLPPVAAVGAVRATCPRSATSRQPKLAFFFDEAHLLFERLATRFARKGRAGRSPDPIEGCRGLFHHAESDRHSGHRRGAAGNRIQHKLNAFTPRDQQAVKSAADTFRPNPAIDVASAITELKIGEALVSLLQEDGSPSPVQRTLIKPPSSRVGPISPQERQVLVTTDAGRQQVRQPARP